MVMITYVTTTDTTNPITLSTTTLKQTPVCAAECLNRIVRAIIFGVMPVISILICLALIRVIINRIEVFYYRRQKNSTQRISLSAYQTGRLVLPYTPVAPAELQRIIQGSHTTTSENGKLKHGRTALNNNTSIFFQTTDDTNTNNNRKTFLKSITTSKSKQPLSNALSSLIMKRDNGESNLFMSLLATSQTPSQTTPKLNATNEMNINDKQYFCVRRSSIETVSVSSSVPHRSSDILDLYYKISEESQINEPETTTMIVQESTENFEFDPSSLTSSVIGYENMKNETPILSPSDNNCEQNRSSLSSNECLAELHHHRK
ncbi:unnamed protein product [Didymodactylos carnosus]|uniref:Uncharacterized protein n=1 Tax=Didymodactylos carnosus TaxID=1234261 RepID=A0A814Q0H3_9BILA|nr:unnamed protein product [Didymodactylos carnosus]CAF1112984.1 unnamed protein product [Didymodactylos carnosus]CAF3589405.1 unnamed protein product [Didymodactylos carnosus]CAF3877151.1 unnamed protein product [Didymodactylos carnosus]